MKRLLILVFFAALASAQYAGPRTVYILPMAAGLDQYIAQWLTRDHAMQVVADPKAAEVVMTDRLGEAFEQKLEQIRPAEKKSDSKDSSSNALPNTFRSSKGRGTIFLVAVILVRPAFPRPFAIRLLILSAAYLLGGSSTVYLPPAAPQA